MLKNKYNLFKYFTPHCMCSSFLEYCIFYMKLLLYPKAPIFVLYLYLYTAQYFHVLQDSKRYMTHSTVQVQSNSQGTDIPPTERQRLKDVSACTWD